MYSCLFFNTEVQNGNINFSVFNHTNRVLEPAHTRCESSNKFDFRSFTRSFHIPAFTFGQGVLFLNLLLSLQ